TGALARIAIATGSFIAVSTREVFRIGTEEERKPQPPHQQYGRHNPVALPPATGGDNDFAQAQRPARTFESLAERNILHQRDRRKTADCMKRITPHEYRLIPRGYAGDARSNIHEPRDDREEAMGTIDSHIEPTPRASAAIEGAEHDMFRVLGQPGIGMEKQQHVA